MKACRIERPGKAELVDTDDIGEYPPQEEQTTIKVHHIGLCGTDLRTFLGENPIVDYPRIIGHEIGGTLTSSVTIGDSQYPAGTVVAIDPYTSCGTCPACRTGRANACMFNETLGNQRDGAGRELFQVPISKILPLPGFETKTAACVEPLSVGFHAAKRAGIKENEVVVVLGAGVIGLGVVAGARFRKATVIAVDLDNRKLELARSLGATVTVNAAEVDVGDSIRRFTKNEGADVVVEAVGAPQTYRQAIELVGYTGRVVFIGYAKNDISFTTKEFVTKELDIKGSRNAQRDDFIAVIEAIRSGTLPIDNIVTHIFPIDQIQKAFDLWSEKPLEVTKILMEV